MALISQLQKFEPTDWSGLTTENHLGAMYGLEPILVSPLINNIYDVNMGLDIDRFMDKFPVLTIEDDRSFEWLLQGSDLKNIPLISYSDSAGNTPVKPGIAYSSFFIVVPERYFEVTDLIGLEDKEHYQLRVVADPRAAGINWQYEVALLTGDTNLFVPATQLTAGKRLVKMYSPVEQTLSKRGGTVNHTSPFRMQNRCSTIRKNYDVPGNMISKGQNTPLAFYFKDTNGNTQTTWIGKLDFDFLTQFKREKAILMMYANSNMTSQGAYAQKGESGFEIKVGSGLYEQISPSNVHFYSTFSLDVLTDILMSLSVGKLSTDSRKFVLGTGEYGMRQFHKAVETKGVAFGPNRTDARITGSGFKMGYSGQFVEYGYIQGIEITLMHIPFLDDPALNPAVHPDGGLMSSYEYLILDFGTQNGQPNIQKVQVKGQEEVFAYIAGMRDPFTPNSGTKPKQISSLVDGYTVARQYTGGCKVHNPLRLARFLPNFS